MNMIMIYMGVQASEIYVYKRVVVLAGPLLCFFLDGEETPSSSVSSSGSSSFCFLLFPPSFPLPAFGAIRKMAPKGRQASKHCITWGSWRAKAGVQGVAEASKVQPTKAIRKDTLMFCFTINPISGSYSASSFYSPKYVVSSPTKIWFEGMFTVICTEEGFSHAMSRIYRYIHTLIIL